MDDQLRAQLHRPELLPSEPAFSAPPPCRIRSDRHNRLLHILGGTSAAPAWPDVHAPNSIRLHQDANVYVSESDADKRFELTLGANRQAYLVCIEGG
jgi:hypothetical protein